MDVRQRRVLCLVLACLSYFFFPSFLLPSVSSQGTHPSLRHRRAAVLDNGPDPVPANSTLGFGAIAAVSRLASPRRASLLVAANITELDISIPVQPVWTPEDLAHVRAQHDSKITNGSALAWLGHLNVLDWFLASDLETVLILEDDVDWDIHLRTSQVPRVAAAVRQLLHASSSSTSSAPRDVTKTKITDPKCSNDKDAAYWGPTDAWDMLYLGHCGDRFDAAKSSSLPQSAFSDPTLPPADLLHPVTRDFLATLNIPPQTRLVHKSVFPLCTFGFALTRRAAWVLRHEIASRERDGGTMAYDVRVLEACRDEGMRCWSVNPELFHHVEGGSEIAVVDHGAVERNSADGDSKNNGSDRERHDVVEIDVKRTPSDDLKAYKNTKQSPFVDTSHRSIRTEKEKGALLGDPVANIACGARSGRYFTTDPKTLEYLREVVGREGRCLMDIGEAEVERSDVSKYVDGDESRYVDGDGDGDDGVRGSGRRLRMSRDDSVSRRSRQTIEFL